MFFRTNFYSPDGDVCGGTVILLVTRPNLDRQNLDRQNLDHQNY